MNCIGIGTERALGQCRRGVLYLLATGIVMAGHSAATAQTSGGEAQAANDTECATVVTPEHVQKVRELVRKGLYEYVEIPAEYRLVRLAFYVIRDNAGNGGLAVSRIAEAIDSANVHYDSTRIVFYPARPVQYIDNDGYFDSTTQAEANQLRQDFTDEGAISIFFVPRFHACGQATFPHDADKQGIILQNSCVANTPNHSTFTHEIGHYLDILHPHDTTFGKECVDGSNCVTAGDLICDTPADPKLSGKVDTSCVYTGTDTDSCNGDPYAPLTDNIMSYSRKACRVAFTPGQETRANTGLVAYRTDHIVGESPCGTATYVDGSAGGTESGTLLEPYHTVGVGIQNACSQGFVVIAAGTYNEAPITINSAVKLVASGGTAVITGAARTVE